MQDDILRVSPELIRDKTGACSVKLLHISRLSGGAIQDNFAIDVEIRGGS